MKGASGIHTWLYRASGGRIGRGFQGMPVLLLTTTGRKSGKSRTTPLLYLCEGDAIVVVGSNGGSDYTPAWWLNLQHDAHAEVEIGRARTRVTARKASPEEHVRLWAEFTSRYPGYTKYATKTAREIPVVMLEPR